MNLCRLTVVVASALCILPLSAETQTVALSPDPIQHYSDNNGQPCSSCLLFTYAAGTTTKQNTFTDSTGGTPNANPIVLNARGEAGVWLTNNAAYKYTLSPATDTDPPSNPILSVDNIMTTGAGSNNVATLAALNATSTTLFPNGVWRNDYATGNGAPPLFYRAGTGACSVNNGGSQASSSDGKCWLAAFPFGLMDIREFGATTAASDNISAFDAAFNAMEAGDGSCVFIPSSTIGFNIRTASTRGSSLSGNGAAIVIKAPSLTQLSQDCIRGTQAGGIGSYGAATGASQINVTGPIDGISQIGDGSRVNGGATLAGFSIANTDTPISISPNVTVGLFRGLSTGWHISDLYIKDFVICAEWNNAGGQETETNVQCSQQTATPNIVNGYPMFAQYFNAPSGQVQELRSVGAQDYANQLTSPLTTGPAGTGGAYSFTINLGTVGPVQTNLFSSIGLRIVVNGVLQTLGVAYNLQDVTVPANTLYGVTDNAVSVTNGSPTMTISVASEAQLPTSISAGGGPPWCNFTPVIIVLGTGIPPATCATSISGATVTLNQNVESPTGTQAATLTQAYLYNQAGCSWNQTTSTGNCAHIIQATFLSGSYPPGAAVVTAQWSDPTGLAGLFLNRGASADAFYGYGAGGYLYNLVERTHGNIIDLIYSQISYAESYIFPNGSGDVLNLADSSNSTHVNQPAFIAPSAKFTELFNSKIMVGNGEGTNTFPPQSVIVSSGTYTITPQQLGTTFNNAGSSGEVDFDLPPASAGLDSFCFQQSSNGQTEKIVAAGSDKISVAGSTSAAGGNIVATAGNAFICLAARSTGGWVTKSTPDKTQWTVN